MEINNQEVLARFFDLALDLLCIADTDGHFIKLNKEWENTLGYNLNDLEGKRFLDFVHPDDIESTLDVMKDLRSDKTILNFTNRYRKKDGTYRWIEWRSFPAEKLIYAAARDVTDHIVSLHKLDQLNNFNKNLFESSPVGLAVFSTSGICNSVNKAFCKIFRISASDLTGKNFNEIDILKNSGLNNLFHNTLNSGQPAEIQIHINIIDIWIDCIVSLIEVNDEKNLFINVIDITNEKKSQIQLKESNDILQRFFDASPIPMCFTDMNSNKMEYINNKFTEFFGYSLNDVPNVQDWFNKAYPDNNYREEVVSRWTKALAEANQYDNIVYGGDYKINTADNRILICEIIASIVGDKMIVLFNEKTQRIIQENLYKESERRFTDTLGNIDLLSVVLNSYGEIQFVNNYTLKLLGCRLEDIVDKNWYDLFVEDKETKLLLKNQLKTEQVPQKFVNTIVATSGEIRVIKWFNTIFRNLEGKFIGLASIGEDITEENILQDILDFRYKLIEYSAKNDLDAVVQYTLDTAERLTESQIGFFHYLDTDQKTLLLQTWSTNTLKKMCTIEAKGMHYSVDKAGIWVEAIHKKQPVIHNDYIQHPDRIGLPDGHAPVLREMVIPIIRNDKIMAVIGVGNKESYYGQKDIEVVSVLMDSAWNVIIAKKAEEELKASEALLKEMNYTKDRFFSIIAHDLKNPFLSLMGYSNMLLEDYDVVPKDEFREYLIGINNLTNNTYKLLQNLLDWAKIQRGIFKVEMEVLDLSSSFDDILKILEESAATKNIKLEIRMQECSMVNADKNMIQTVFRNLVTNAIKFSYQNSKIIISSSCRDNEYIISVKDFGIGMHPNTYYQLFKLEHTISSRGTNNETGTGLGLILCKDMLELMNGRIWAESEEYKGSTFYFALPCAKTEINK